MYAGSPMASNGYANALGLKSRLCNCVRIVSKPLGKSYLSYLHFGWMYWSFTLTISLQIWVYRRNLEKGTFDGLKGIGRPVKTGFESE